MKILFVSLGNQFDIRDALNDYGEVIYWDWSGRDRTFNRDLISIYNKHKPDLVFMQIQTGGRIDVHTARAMKDAFVINWTGDVRYPLPKWYTEIGRNISLTLFTNMPDVHELRRNGVNADYLDIGFPEKIFKTKGDVRNEADIVFMGNNVGGFPLSQYRANMVTILRKRYGNFKCFGVNWTNYSPETNQEEEAKIYRGSKIAINLSHFNYERYSSDRILRIMGTGTLCLSHNYPAIESDYEIGKHLDVWSNFEELFEKIDYYMANEAERKRIADAGCKHVHENHTWKNRIKQLSEMIGKK